MPKLSHSLLILVSLVFCGCSNPKGADQVVGQVEVDVHDYFDGRQARQDIFIRTTAQERIQLNAQSPEIPALVASTGSSVSVTGTLTNNTMAANEVKIPDAKTVASPTVSPLHILVIPVRFSDEAESALLSAAFLSEAFFTGTNSVANFYYAASFQQQLVDGSVLPYLALDASLPKNCDESVILAQAVAYASSQVGASSLNGFTNLITVMPGACNAPEGEAAAASLGKRTIHTTAGDLSVGLITSYQIPQSMFIAVLAHEIGHNLGLLHANLLDCGSLLSIGSLCSGVPYGDKFEAMGNNPDGPGFFGAPHLAKLGWIPPTQIRQITSSGTYSIDAIETSSAGVKFLKIGPGDNDYYLEFRTPVGFDQPEMNSIIGDGNGIQIRRNAFDIFAQGSSNKIAFINSPNETSHPVLRPNETFFDGCVNFRVTTLAVTSVNATVQIDMNVLPAEEAASRCMDLTAPVAPKDVQVSKNLINEPGFTHNVRLDWTAASDPSGIAMYLVSEWVVAEISNSGCTQGGLVGDFITSDNYFLADCETLCTCIFSVVAVDSVGNKSDSSANVSITVPSRVPPTPPQNFRTGTVSASDVVLIWDPSTTPSVVKYLIGRCETGGVLNVCNSIGEVAATKAMTFTDISATSGSAYVYEIYAVDGNDNVSDPVKLSVSVVR